jgi:hypothetical protein
MKHFIEDLIGAACVLALPFLLLFVATHPPLPRRSVAIIATAISRKTI